METKQEKQHYLRFVNRETQVKESYEDIDNKMCAAFGVEPSASGFYCNWYDVISLIFAMGFTFHNIDMIVHDIPEAKRIVEWLEEHYEVQIDTMP